MGNLRGTNATMTINGKSLKFTNTKIDTSFKFNGSIVEKLKDSNVVTFKKIDENNFRVRERCDRFFSANLTKSELLDLSHELKVLAES